MGSAGGRKIWFTFLFLSCIKGLNGDQKKNDAGGRNMFQGGCWCCGNSKIKWTQPEHGDPIRSNMDENMEEFIAPESDIYHVDIFNAKRASSGNYERIFLVANGLKQLEKKDIKQTYKVQLNKGETIAVWIADHSSAGSAINLGMDITWGKSTAELEVFDYNDLIDLTKLPSFADPENNCKLGYCGQNARCTTLETCECKEGHSGSPYFWGGCVPDPCDSNPCGRFSTCERTIGIGFKCTCPEGLNYLPDPDDPMSCVLNLCSNEESLKRKCKPNFEEETCDCERDPSVQPPPDVDPEDGFYGEWGEWSDCPLTCRASENDLPMRRTRRRVCNMPMTQSGLPCSGEGPPIQEQMCNEMLCPRPPSWSRWGPWESCSSACPEDGQGTQQRRRICLETGTMEDTCADQPPLGPVVQTTKCQAPEGLSCAGSKLAQWGTWSSCDLTCSNSDEMGIQLRSRLCSSSSEPTPSNYSGAGLDPSSGQACFGLHESAFKQFRVCPELPTCSIEPCHADWWKPAHGAKFYHGCADPENQGLYWCPSPGGVDSHGVVKINGPKHNCSEDEVEDALQTNRVRRNVAEENDGVSFQRGIEDCYDQEDGDICSALNSIYAEDSNRKLNRTEKIGFVKDLIQLVGWDPLTRDDMDYRSPFVKFDFYQDALHILPEYMKQCTAKTPNFKHKKLQKECPKILEGKTKFTMQIQDSVEKIQDLSERLNQTVKDYAKAKIANAVVGTTAAVAGTTAAVIGVACAPVTFGASLALTVVGASSAAVGIGVAASTLFTTLAENDITNKKLDQLKSEHQEAGRCLERIITMNIALDESSIQVSRFLGTKDWEQTMKKLGDLKTVQMKEDIEFIVERYIEAYSTAKKSMGDDKFKELLKDIEFKEDDDDPEAEDTSKTGSEISKEVLTQVTDCVGQVDQAECILNHNPIALLIKGLQLGIDPNENKEGWFVANRAFETYKVGKGAIRDLAVYERLNEFVEKFSATNAVPLKEGETFNLLSDTKITSQTKRYRFMAKVQDRFTRIAGGPTLSIKGSKVKLFDAVSDFKKGTKEATLKLARRGLTKLGLKSGKFGTTSAGKLSAKLFAKATKLAGTLAGKVVSKLAFGVLDIGLGVWEIYTSVKQLTDGSKESIQFYKASIQLEGAMMNSSDYIQTQYEECSMTYLERSCTWSEWGPWSSCEPSNSFDFDKKREEGTNVYGWVHRRKRTEDVQDGSYQEAFLCTGAASQIKSCFTDSIIKGPGWIKVTEFSDSPTAAVGYYRKTRDIGEGGRAVYIQSGRSGPSRIEFEGGKWSIKTSVQSGADSFTFQVAATCNTLDSKCPLGKAWVGDGKLRVTCETGGCSEFAPVDCALTLWSNWSTCSRQCDKGTKSRTRNIKTRPDHGGLTCSKNKKETKACTIRPCKAPDSVFEGNWGTWASSWSLCPEGSYVFGLRLRTEKDQGWWTDDTAANAIELACRKPLSTRTIRTLRTKVKTWGDWSTWSYCSGSNNPVESFYVKNNSPEGTSDDTSVNDVKMVCQNGYEAKVSANTGWGSWSSIRSCRKGYAVVGIKTRVDEGGFGAYDDTALNGIRVKCEFYKKN